MFVADVPTEVLFPVVVSLKSEVEEVVVIAVQPLVSYLSYVLVVVLYLNIPTAPVERCAVVPEGSFNDPVAPDKSSISAVKLILLCVIYKSSDVCAFAL